MMARRVGYVTVLVHDYDEAIDYYTKVLGFHLIENTPLSPQKRWVLVSPDAEGKTCLLLARAASEAQSARVGDQTGGRVFLFLHTADFWADYHAMRSRGVQFEEAPRQEEYGMVAVFTDLYGNRWDLLG
jgi:catechol 2,3-dioxygenase-like lactoylglutathione lyase family enzyme